MVQGLAQPGHGGPQPGRLADAGDGRGLDLLEAARLGTAGEEAVPAGLLAQVHGAVLVDAEKAGHVRVHQAGRPLFWVPASRWPQAARMVIVCRASFCSVHQRASPGQAAAGLALGQRRPGVGAATAGGLHVTVARLHRPARAHGQAGLRRIHGRDAPVAHPVEAVVLVDAGNQGRTGRGGDAAHGRRVRADVARRPRTGKDEAVAGDVPGHDSGHDRHERRQIARWRGTEAEDARPRWGSVGRPVGAGAHVDRGGLGHF